MSIEKAIMLYYAALKKFPYSLNVTTVPHFHLDMKYLGEPCWFYYNENGILGNKVEFDSTQGVQGKTSVLSGMYQILGIKHDISQGNASTNLNLIRWKGEDS